MGGFHTIALWKARGGRNSEDAESRMTGRLIRKFERYQKFGYKRIGNEFTDRFIGKGGKGKGKGKLGEARRKSNLNAM